MVLSLDMFYEDTILNDFEISLLIDTFYEKNRFEASKLVLDMFFDMYNLHGF